MRACPVLRINFYREAATHIIRTKGGTFVNPGAANQREEKGGSLDFQQLESEDNAG